MRSLVEMHDGTVQADSMPGTGTTVTVRLPSAGAQAPVLADGGNHRPAVAGTASAYVDEALQWLDAGTGDALPGPPGRSGRWCWSRTTTPTCAATWPGC